MVKGRDNVPQQVNMNVNRETGMRLSSSALDTNNHPMSSEHHQIIGHSNIVNQQQEQILRKQLNLQETNINYQHLSAGGQRLSASGDPIEQSNQMVIDDHEQKYIDKSNLEQDEEEEV